MNDFIAAIHRLCNNPKLRATLLSWRWPLSLGGLLLLFILMDKRYFWPGLLLCLVGEALQVWCFACLHKKKELAAKGPYSLVRNPMYLGRYLLLLGAVAMTGSIFLMLLFSVVYYFYMVNRVQREEEVLVEIFGEPYQEYCRNTGRFWPNLARTDQETLKCFSWDLFFKNNAHLNLAAVLAAGVLLYIFLF